MSTISFLLEANMNWIELKRKYGIDRPGRVVRLNSDEQDDKQRQKEEETRQAIYGKA